MTQHKPQGTRIRAKGVDPTWSRVCSPLLHLTVKEETEEGSVSQRDSQCYSTYSWDWGRHHQPRKLGGSKSWKTKETESSLEPWKETSLTNTLILPTKCPFSISDFQNCKRMNLFFKPLSMRYFVIAPRDIWWTMHIGENHRELELVQLL